MSDVDGATGRHPLTRLRPDRWQMWTLPPAAIGFLLTVTAIAVAAAALALRAANPTDSDLARFVALAVLGIGYGELGDRIDRFRRYLASTSGPYVDPTSVWIFAGVLLLPAGWAAALTILIYLHMALRAHRTQSWRPHRLVFTAAAMLLSVVSASAVNSAACALPLPVPDGAASSLGIVVTLLCFHLVNHALVAIMMYLAARPARFSEVLLGRDEMALEMITLILGIYTAEIMFRTPWLSPTVALLVILLHRGALVAQLQQAATTDGSTGLLNATAWRARAQQQLSHAAAKQAPAALLILDLDGFKAVNDTHGHLAGDAVLREVASCLAAELHDFDALGRYGGDEFVAFLADVDPRTAGTIADRLHERLGQLGPVTGPTGPPVPVGASVGLATFPQDGTQLDELLLTADLALYRAKTLSHRASRLNRAPFAPPVVGCIFNGNITSAESRHPCDSSLLPRPRKCHPHPGWIDSPGVSASVRITPIPVCELRGIDEFGESPSG